MSEIRVAAIVGGHGETEAVPILFRRIAGILDPALVVRVEPILRVPETCLAKPDGLEKPIELAARKIGGHGGIFILADCDRPDGCPKQDAPAWLSRARHARPDLPISVVLACQEYEAWFIAAAESLRGRRGLAMDVVPDPRPESIRGAKEWLSRHMPPNRPYTETTDQPAFTAIFDMQVARRADSFDKCYREIVRLLTVLQPGG